MNKTVDRAFNQEVLHPADHADDYFPELCAASTSGTLTPGEWTQLEVHLSMCESCRKLKAEYDAVIATTLPAMAADRLEPNDDHTPDSWSLEQAEASLMERIERENISPDTRPEPSRETSGWRLPWHYAGAAALIVTSSVIGYYIGILHGHRTLPATPAVALPANRDTAIQKEVRPIGRPTKGTDEGHSATEAADLRNQLHVRLAEIAALRDEQTSLRSELAARTADLDNAAQQRAQIAQQLALAQTSAQDLQTRLDGAVARIAHETAPADTLQMRVNQLTAELDAKDQQIAERDKLLEHDRDIRNLIGARDLLINDVYDVAKTGKTQKAFGRVFYTKGKSLIFYAYDLDQQPGVKLASTFQVWGSRGMDQEHAVDLGILYQDDRDKKRWILKSSDPTTLAQLDAVFVTLEPHGASARPTGKPLLFTYLRLSSNHP